MDYKRKYLKYKIKYMNLLGGMKTFTTKKNNGNDNSGNYSNQCMWISILDYINDVMGNNLNLDEIRRIAIGNDRLNINGTREQFDTDLHLTSLKNLTYEFDLQVHLYVSFKNKENKLVIGDEPNWIIGNYSSSNVISIVSYGAHFELITSIGSRVLYGGKIKDSSIFTPNINLILGKKIILKKGYNKPNSRIHEKVTYIKKINSNEISSNEDEEEKKENNYGIEENNLNENNLDYLMNLYVFYEGQILCIKQDIERKQAELKILEESFVMENSTAKTQEEEDIQIAMIYSLQEHKLILENNLKSSQKDLGKMEESKNEIKIELDKFIE